MTGNTFSSKFLKNAFKLWGITIRYGRITLSSAEASYSRTLTAIWDKMGGRWVPCTLVFSPQPSHSCFFRSLVFTKIPVLEKKLKATQNNAINFGEWENSINYFYI